MLTIQIILVIVSILFLSNYDTIWGIVDKKKAHKKYKEGFYVIIMLGAIFCNIFLITETKNDNEHDKTILSNSLRDIKRAITNAHLNYDSTTNVIIGGNVEQHGGINFAGVSSPVLNNVQSFMVGGEAAVDYIDNVTGKKTKNNLYSTDELNAILEHTKQIQQITKNNCVYIFQLKPEKQTEATSQLTAFLTSKGYIISGVGFYQLMSNWKASKIYFMKKDDCIGIYMPPIE